MPNLHSTGYDKSCTSKDEQANCKASEDVILPNAGIYSSGAETQPDSKKAHVKIKNETHGLVIYNIYLYYIYWLMVGMAPRANDNHINKAGIGR